MARSDRLLNLGRERERAFISWPKTKSRARPRHDMIWAACPFDYFVYAHTKKCKVFKYAREKEVSSTWGLLLGILNDAPYLGA